MNRAKVVLFFPAYDGPPLGAPTCLLAIASPLLAAGFDVSIIDAAIVPDAETRVLREIQDALCLGVSLLTGPMITSTLRICRQVKRIRPDLHIVLGGWHPSLMPYQTLQSDCVDVVVRGQGELTMVELAERLAQNRSLEGLHGTSFKDGGQPVHNPDRPVENINRLPSPAYHLVDFAAYEAARGMREIGYASSVGCPYACNYCTDQVFYNRRFNAYRADRVVEEVIGLVERYRLSEVAFFDSNFLVDVKRALAIARGFLDRKVRFGWSVQASTDLLCRMSDAEVELLGESGLNHLGFGTESASLEVLALMNKKHQRIEDMYETARKTGLAGIRATFNVILGYPGETHDDRLQTFRIMSDIARSHSNVSFSPNVFTPYPGIPIWPQLRDLGVKEPQSLEEWSAVSLGNNLLPWLQGAERRRLRRMIEYFLLNNQIRKTAQGWRWHSSALHRALGAPLRWRLRTNRYSFPWELWVSRMTERVASRRSLLTGQELAHQAREVC
jgi:radical SAM superfamily enzyme YgiQ (UPF0313 family)